MTRVQEAMAVYIAEQMRDSEFDELMQNFDSLNFWQEVIGEADKIREENKEIQP